MGLTIYQTITPAETTLQSIEKNGPDCTSGKRGYSIKTWCGVRRSTCLLSIYVIAYFLFLIAGSILFSNLEQSAEESIKIDIDDKKKEFIKKHPWVKDDDLEKLLDDIMYRGISPREKDLSTSNWSFGQSLLFTVTVVTTIGKVPNQIVLHEDFIFNEDMDTYTQ